MGKKQIKLGEMTQKFGARLFDITKFSLLQLLSVTTTLAFFAPNTTFPFISISIVRNAQASAK